MDTTDPVDDVVPSTTAPVDDAAVDLGSVGRQLADVESALERLDAGTYWTDEVTGETIPDHVLAIDPVARRVSA